MLQHLGQTCYVAKKEEKKVRQVIPANNQGMSIMSLSFTYQCCFMVTSSSTKYSD